METPVPQRVSPDDHVATLPEVRAAVESLSQAELLRLERFSVWRMRGLGNFDAGRTHEDLLYEAIRLVLEGRRRWRPARVEFVGCLLGAIRSIASNWARHAAMASDVESDSMGWPDLARSAPPSPEETLLRAEREEAIMRRFAADALATSILLDLRGGASFADIRTRHGLTKLEYETTMRRIRRRVLAVNGER